jgi:hypothetical protein
MSILNDLFKGAIALAFIALIDHGFTVKDMAKSAAKAHKKGLTSYGAYSRMLTGHNGSWAKPDSNDLNQFK